MYYFHILFSILLLPINLLCAAWLFREALSCTGMTFHQFCEQNASLIPTISTRRTRRTMRFLAGFFAAHSTDPKRSMRFTRAFGVCTLPGVAALFLAGYAAMGGTYIWLGEGILCACNAAIYLWGRLYPRQGKAKKWRLPPLKHIIVYGLFACVFLSFLTFFTVGIAGIARSNVSQPCQERNAIAIQAALIPLLEDHGYETANVPTTYWAIDADKLEHVAAGGKADSKFEFYGYTDGDTVAGVYEQILQAIAPTLSPTEREQHETALSGGGRICTMEQDGTQYLVLCQNDTVVYAHTHGEPEWTELREILAAVGYVWE